ncbi:hypothetical protein MRB53_041998 [Persea americana]|nr:hypothetical protein MRB53_041998 [Persea americana]
MSSSESRQAIALLSKWAEIDVDDALELLGSWCSDSRGQSLLRLTACEKADDEELLLYLLQLVQALKFEPQQAKSEDETDSSLASFLIARSAANFKLGNFLYWYLMVELELDNDNALPSSANKKLFARVSFDLCRSSNLRHRARSVARFSKDKANSSQCYRKSARTSALCRGKRPRKIEQLRKILADPRTDLLSFDPPLPLPP